MDKNDQINKFVEFSKEIIKTEGINEETLSKISKELSKLSNIEDLFNNKLNEDSFNNLNN